MINLKLEAGRIKSAQVKRFHLKNTTWRISRKYCREMKNNTQKCTKPSKIMKKSMILVRKSILSLNFRINF